MCVLLSFALLRSGVTDGCWNGSFQGSTSDLPHSTHLVTPGALTASILFAESIVAHTVQQLWKVPVGSFSCGHYP